MALNSVVGEVRWQYQIQAGRIPSTERQVLVRPLLPVKKRRGCSLHHSQRKLAPAAELRDMQAARVDRNFFDGDDLQSRMARRPSPSSRRGKSVVTISRSSLIAKQVISRSSGRNLGVVTQVWVDTGKWQVVVLDLRPSLLYGQVVSMFLSAVVKIGDVLLVEDETVLNEGISLFTHNALVGHDMWTEDGIYLGKLRDFDFIPDTGEISTVSFDGLGNPLVPAVLISTYMMQAGEVLSVGPDRTIVARGAQARIRQATRGVFQRLGITDPPWRDIDDIVGDRSSYRSLSNNETPSRANRGAAASTGRMPADPLEDAPEPLLRPRSRLPPAPPRPEFWPPSATSSNPVNGRRDVADASRSYEPLPRRPLPSRGGIDVKVGGAKRMSRELPGYPQTKVDGSLKPPKDVPRLQGGSIEKLEPLDFQ